MSDLEQRLIEDLRRRLDAEHEWRVALGRQLAEIRVAAQVELERIERDGGYATFPMRVMNLAREKQGWEFQSER